MVDGAGVIPLPAAYSSHVEATANMIVSRVIASSWLCLKFIFNLLLGPGGPGGGSGLPVSGGDRRLWADSGPNPGIFNFHFGIKHS